MDARIAATFADDAKSADVSRLLPEVEAAAQAADAAIGEARSRALDPLLSRDDVKLARRDMEIEDSAEQMAWRIGGSGFDMSGHVPRTLATALPSKVGAMLGGRRNDEINLWAVHPGGRSILDAIASTLELTEDALDVSRDILRRFGNMSSATVIFVLKTLAETFSTNPASALWLMRSADWPRIAPPAAAMVAARGPPSTPANAPIKAPTAAPPWPSFVISCTERRWMTPPRPRWR